MQNFLLGQAELDKRKQDLAEQLRQEEEQRREQARFESEKQEKIRCVFINYVLLILVKSILLITEHFV